MAAPETTPIKLVRYSMDQHEETLNDWIADPEVTRYMATGRLPKLNAADEDWASRRDGDFVFAVYHGLAYVGIAGLYATDIVSQKAELRILIGQGRGHGLGTEAVRLLLDFGFGRLNLHRIYLGTAQENKAALRAFEKNGFKIEGLLKDDLYRDGWHHNVRMAVMRGDWEAAREKGME